MREKLKYFIINRAYDFKRGLTDNMHTEGGRLCFHSERKTGVGRYMTRLFDSGESGATWHRLLLKADGCEKEDLRITVFASDKNEITIKDDTMTLQEMFEDEELSFSEKAEAFRPFAAKQVSGASDILLHEVRGRYLWVMIEQYSSGAEPAGIVEIRIYLPAVSWIDYLPQIYRSSDRDTHFLERYLAIFQTVYEELDLEIASIAESFDPESTDRELLKWLSSWLDIRDTEIWTEEKLRQLLLRAVRLYRMRGTKQGLSELIELYTGEKPFIIEGFELMNNTAQLPAGYAPQSADSVDPYTVTVLVNQGHDLDVIRRIASQMLPVTLRLEIVELDPFIFLGEHSYLGINSSLGVYRPAALDGSSQLMLSTLSGGNEEE